MSLRLSALLALLFVLPAATALAGKADGRLDIYWVDVEGGAATLIVTPQGESILVDSGNPGHRDPDRIFQTLTRDAGLRQLDHLVTTHYHQDHYGGASMLATFLPIGTVYDNGIFEGIRELPDKPYLEFKAERRVVLSPGDEIELQQPVGDVIPKLTLRCLVARQKMIELAGGVTTNECCQDLLKRPVDNSDNANSIVLLLSYGDFDFFDAGDLTWNVEERLVCPVNLVGGEVDVYQVSHHGLDISNNPVVLRTLKPTVAVMNNGVTKGCQPNTFAALKSLDSLQALYQMHKNLREDIATVNTGDQFIANLEAECSGNIIKLSVDPTGKTYTVSIPARKHEKTFESK